MNMHMLDLGRSVGPLMFANVVSSASKSHDPDILDPAFHPSTLVFLRVPLRPLRLTRLDLDDFA